MDSLISVIMKVAECFVDPTKKRAKLITNHEAIKAELKEKREQLLSDRAGIQSRVKRAENNNERILEQVDEWLKEVEDIEKSWPSDIDDKMGKSSGSTLNLCQRYKLSKVAIKKKRDVDSLLERGTNFRESEVSEPITPKRPNPDNVTDLESAHLYADKTLKALKESSTKIVGLVGMGGIGKTTVAGSVADKARKIGLFDLVLFAVVSQAQVIRKIQGQLGDNLGLTFSREGEAGRADQLRNKINQARKVLIILDDVWSTINFSDIGIPFGDDHEGCKILLTTRREQVCKSMDCQKSIEVEPLNDNDAWSLFQRKVGEILLHPSHDLKEVATQVMQECKGLPLALVVLGCAMKGRDLDEWRLVAERLRNSRLPDIEAVEEDVYACLKLSFDYLKSEATKKCFLLCSLFPEDHEIQVEELAKYVLGFGEFQDIDSFEFVKSRVQGIVKDLKESSLLLKTNDMTKYVKMHDVIRDAALWITSELGEKFVVPISSGNNWTKNDNYRNAVAISLLACPMNNHFPAEGDSFLRLKFLILAQRAPLQVTRSCFQGMKTLQVLDLTAEEYRLALVLPRSLKGLQNLRTLLIRRWELQGDISMIGSLINLVFLSFSGSLIKQLPKQMEKLSMLKVLDLSGCSELGNSYTEVQRHLCSIEEIYTPNKPCYNPSLN